VSLSWGETGGALRAAAAKANRRNTNRSLSIFTIGSDKSLLAAFTAIAHHIRLGTFRPLADRAADVRNELSSAA